MGVVSKDKRGLTQKEADEKLAKFGKNELKDLSKKSPLKILFRQVRSNFLIYLLLVASILSFIVGKSITGYIILLVIFMVIIVGFAQEYRAERALSALKRMIMPISIVLRNGKEVEVMSSDLVPDDVILLRSGERIPADCIILEQKDLIVNESVLTGESREIKKERAINLKNYTDINLLFMGSFVINGKALCKVIHTGMNTRFGKIAGMISTAEKELPLQKKVNKIAKYMAFFAVTISILTGLLMIFRADSLSTEFLIEVLIITIAISVSAFPEGFPVVLITSLATGVHKMAKENAIVNRMSVIETLGETTVICSDKTGTITRGEMTVKNLFADNKLFEVTGTGFEAEGEFLYGNSRVDVQNRETLKILFKTILHCNDSRIERTGEDMVYRPIGTPTEAALLIMAAKASYFREDHKFKIIEELPFNSDRKIMAVLGKDDTGNYVFVKGAPEIVISKCEYILKNGKKVKLSKKEKTKLLTINNNLTNKTYRTLALAYKSPETLKTKDFDDELIFLGIAGMEDPPRDGVKEAILTCQKAGIKVKMITGDNKETAIAIGKQVHLTGKVLEGFELDKLSDDELRKKIVDITIFARVRPEHKLRIVKALKENGEIVSMTGDGVNDAPALKEAHIGIAMGKCGTDVSREVADLTLKDDDFITIVQAIKQGRTVFNNIRKFVTYQLSCNFAELTILFIGVLLSPLYGWPVPVLLALQILFMNLVTDNLPAITLGLNNASNDIMLDKPRKKAEILNSRLIFVFIFAGILMASFSLITFWYTYSYLGQTIEDARTTTLVTLILLEIAGAFNFRSFRKGTLTRSPVTNPFLIIASIISLFATIIIVYSPLNGVFGTVPIPISDWLVALFFAFILVVIFDLFKKLNNRLNFINLE